MYRWCVKCAPEASETETMNMKVFHCVEVFYFCLITNYSSHCWKPCTLIVIIFNGFDLIAASSPDGLGTWGFHWLHFGDFNSFSVCLLSSACPPGLHGPLCQLQCDCMNGASCHPVSGQCICPPGYHGARCHRGQISPVTTSHLDKWLCRVWLNQSVVCVTPLLLPLFPVCEQGLYGPSCAKVCDCQGNGACDPVTGKCLCSSGKTGPRCDIGNIQQTRSACLCTCICLWPEVTVEMWLEVPNE